MFRRKWDEFEKQIQSQVAELRDGLFEKMGPQKEKVEEFFSQDSESFQQKKVEFRH